MVGHAAADPVAGTEEVAALDLREVLDAERPRHGEVDRLAAGLRQRLEVRLRQLLQPAAMGEAPQDRPGLEAATPAVLLDQALALERAQEAAGRALGQRGVAGQVGQGARLFGFDHQREQLRGAVDGLRPSLELLFHGRYVTEPCSSTQCRATRS